MKPTADELAGVVDLFGALTRAELVEGLSELAFKRGEEVADPAGAIDDAVASYHLVTVPTDEGELLAVGPAAFPDLPEGATDLPHIMDVPERSISREQLADVVEEQFREESVVALRTENDEFVERLLDVSYELEVWGPVDVADTRTRLEAATED